MSECQSEKDEMALTERQASELAYHRERARTQTNILNQPFSWDVIHHPSRRWWNAYWQMYAYLVTLNLTGKRTLVVGCRYGEDALRLAKLGADVYAFDLSPDSVSIASALAEREGLNTEHERKLTEQEVLARIALVGLETQVRSGVVQNARCARDPRLQPGDRVLLRHQDGAIRGERNGPAAFEWRKQALRLCIPDRQIGRLSQPVQGAL